MYKNYVTKIKFKHFCVSVCVHVSVYVCVHVGVFVYVGVCACVWACVWRSDIDIGSLWLSTCQGSQFS